MYIHAYMYMAMYALSVYMRIYVCKCWCQIKRIDIEGCLLPPVRLYAG